MLPVGLVSLESGVGSDLTQSKLLIHWHLLFQRTNKEASQCTDQQACPQMAHPVNAQIH